MSPITTATDPTGRCFVSYRRSHLDDIEQIVDAMLDCGVPPWQDRLHLTSQPLGPALIEALTSPSTASALLWISEDVAESPAILSIEAPRILERVRSDPAFFAELWLADGMDYNSASEVLRPPGMVEDVGAAWHLERATVHDIPRTTTDGRTITTRRVDVAEAARIAAHILERRLAKNHDMLAPSEPIRLLFNAHAEADEGFIPGYPIHINWSRHFSHRFAAREIWDGRLIPALDRVMRAVRKAAPRRSILVDGRATLASCLALGRAFREVADIPIAWIQKPSGSHWNLAETETDSGFSVEPLRHQHMASNDLAVFVSVTGSVEPAVSATDDLPRFRAVVSVRPSDGSARRDLRSAGEAAHLARMIARAIRAARHDFKTIERTHLFFAGPAGLAMLLGQQLNALGPVQTYEHLQPDRNAVGRYVPAALLTDPLQTF